MSDEKPEEKSMRAGQFWLRGVVESVTQKERGQYTDTIMRLFVSDPDPKRSNTYGIKVFGKALDNLKANAGDEVEVTCYAKGRVWKESVFHDIALGFCKVLKASDNPAQSTESGTREVDAPPVDDPTPF